MLGGNEGDDTLLGGSGNDRIHGDAGNDSLVFAAGIAGVISVVVKPDSVGEIEMELSVSVWVKQLLKFGSFGSVSTRSRSSCRKPYWLLARPSAYTMLPVPALPAFVGSWAPWLA